MTLATFLAALSVWAILLVAGLVAFCSVARVGSDTDHRGAQ